MTPERLAELEALCDAATEGPWVTKGGINPGYFDVVNGVCVICRDADTDAEFIAAARTALPELIAEVERLRGICLQLAGEELVDPQ